MSVLPLSKFFSRQADVASEIDAFESDTAEVLYRTGPRFERATLYVIVGIVVTAILFIAIAKVDRVAVAPGKIVAIEGTLTVHPFDTAIIRSIKVAPGDIVKKGQVLATLDPTFTAADVTALADHERSDAAVVARLQAEQQNRPYEGDMSDPYQALQTAVYQQRQSEFKAGVNNLDEQIQQAAADITRLTKDMEMAEKRLGLASDVEQMRVELEHTDAGSRLNTLAATDTRVSQNQALSTDQNQLNGTRHQLESLRSQRDVYIQQWRTQIATDLVTNSADLDTTRDSLTKAQRMRELVDMTAPEDAIVLSIGNYAVGSVVPQLVATTETVPLLTLVPLDAPLEIEAEIDNQDVGFVRVGDNVQIKLDAYSYTRHGTAKGVVKTISQDSFTLDFKNQPVPAYFKSRIWITDTNLRNVPANFRLIPGMTLIADIMVGKRTILSYLVEGAIKTGSEGMREP